MIILGILIGCVTNNKYTEEDRLRLEKEALKIDEMTNVSARKYYEVYMELGKIYYAEEKYKKSLESLDKGLRLNARDYEMQLIAAKVEFYLEMYEDSYHRLTQIIGNSHDEQIVSEAKKIIRKINKKEIVFSEKIIPDMRKKYIYILKTINVDDIYIEALRSKLEEEYKISIICIDENIEPTKKNYIDRHAEYYLRVIKNFVEENDEEAYNQIIEYLNLDKSDLNEIEINKEFVHFLYLQSDNGEEKWQENIGRIQDQYDADKILKQIRNEYKDKIREEDCLGLLVVVPFDIYTNDYNFLFGWSGNDVAVMSYNRFIRDNQDLTVRIKRVVMQGLSSAGYLIGIPRCTVDTCARAYPHSLAEHDRKNDELCDECKRNLIEVYRKF